MHKPNLTVPLALSYNQRGIAASTNVTNALDQRKINCYYDLNRNSVSGGLSFDLSKRPGVSDAGITAGSSSSNVPYILLNESDTELGQTALRIFATNAGTVYSAETNGSNFTICGVTATGAVPVFADVTRFSGTLTRYVQIAVNGVSSSQRIFYFTGSLPWVEITDGDFPAATATGKLEVMDGFYFIFANQTGVGPAIYNSDLNSISAWTAGNFLAKQIKSDQSLGLARYKNQILAMGHLSTEVFFNAGNASGSPLSPIKQLQSDVGLAANNVTAGGMGYYCSVDDAMYFVGKKDSDVGRSLYKYNGSSFVSVSSNFLNKILSEVTIYALNAINILGKRGVAIRTTDVTAATQKFLIYFPEWNDWFEWTSTTFFPSIDGRFFPGLSASSKGQRIYRFTSTDNWQDDGTSYLYSTQFKLPPTGGQRKRMEEFGVIGDTTATNTLTVEVSDDDYATFTTKATLDLSKVRKSTVRGGTYIDRAIRLSNTNALETRLQSFIALVK